MSRRQITPARTLRALGLLAALGLVIAPQGGARAEPLARSLFGAKSQPSDQPPEPIGFYSRGCASGLMQMPESGPTWQVMRLGRNRNWGQPEMIQFLIDLSAEARSIGWNGLYIGDISQPRGGPMTGGHASHQIGLDADIWMLPPKRLDLSRAEREAISSVSVRSADQRSVTSSYTRAHAALLRAAASDPRVDRVFVAAAVKIEMCKTARPSDTGWLQKIRPIYGHDSHFHVRLKCPAGAGECERQSPTVSELSKGGNGCDETLTWWVTDYLNPPKTGKKPPPEPPEKNARTYTLADLPRQCARVLASD